MIEVICDTNFLVHLATKNIKNISTIDTEIGSIKFVVPQVVLTELEKLKTDPTKKAKIEATLNFVEKFDKIPIKGDFADEQILSHVQKKGGFVATLDKELKRKIKERGGSVISLSNDRIVLEESKI